MAHASNAHELDALLADLTDPQREAVCHTDGPLLVLAGAGCGKTRVITRRAAYLARTVTKPRNVLAITFTNKAASEMYDRISALGVGAEMTICTFHSLCYRLLRIHHERAGLPDDFTVFDSADQRKVIQLAIARAQLSVDNWSPARLQGVISNAKNAMVTATMFANETQDWSERTIAKVYEAYELVLAEQHGLDFDDLLLKLAFLLQDDEDFRRQLERRYTHVLIDEYQDTNSAQYLIAHLITEQNKNICATGDPDQSIYGWRGADIGNILRFEEDHEQAQVVRLERNYRSTKRILAAAGSVIEHNMQRKDKTLWTENDEGSQVRVLITGDGDEESEFIAKELVERRDDGEDLSDVAIFYRLNSLSRAVEEALLQNGVAYQVARGVEFYNRKEIKDVLAYVRLLINVHDEVSLTRIINTPTRGIGKTTIDRIIAHARANGREMFEFVFQPELVPTLKKAAIFNVKAFAELLNALRTVTQESPSIALERIIRETGLQASMTGDSNLDADPLENINELINAAAIFERDHPEATLLEWMEHTSLISDVDAVEDGAGRATLMTLHAAKGLEFPVVYMIGLEDGLLPFQREPGDPTYNEEEERRLCFVGMTRAKRELTLSHTKYRMVRGVSERKSKSPFIDELPDSDIEIVDRTANGADSSRRGWLSDLPHDIAQWGPGTLVRSDDWGLGRIEWIRRNGAQVHLEVTFAKGPTKTLILPFADLERVDFDEVGEGAFDF
jgi:DNA helicase-2/ATP-dependent DNA helicase PcrA